VLFKLDSETNHSHFWIGIIELGIDDRKAADESVASAKVGCDFYPWMA
jgi:hypothetical protein